MGLNQNMQLADLGERICILGPSNSGKSTLAEATARKRSLKVVHLDLLYHLPNTEWEVRPTDEFVALHDTAITGERWVIDGNYSKCMPQHFVRATGLILLDISTPSSRVGFSRTALTLTQLLPESLVRDRRFADSPVVNQDRSGTPPRIGLNSLID
jgi:adenylate kinase family enzyme